MQKFFYKSVNLTRPVLERAIKVNEIMSSQSKNIKTGFLFCPRCGLRKPNSELLGYYGGYCPVCGCRMKEEHYLPYSLKISGLFPKYSQHLSSYAEYWKQS